MKFTLLAAAVGLATAVCAAPPSYSGNGNCLTQHAAETLVAHYAAVIAQQSTNLGNATETAIAITANSYTEQSDSANIQIGIPLGALTTASKQTFVSESQSNPPVVFNTKDIYVACRHITWYWVSTTFGNGELPVQGIHIFTVNRNDKITATRFEFNSIAGAIDIGFTVTYPNGTVIDASNA